MVLCVSALAENVIRIYTLEEEDSRSIEEEEEGTTQNGFMCKRTSCKRY